MIRWSPINKVSSIEPDGIMRACPSVPLISMNARITQNHAMISLFTFALIGTSASFALFFLLLPASAFTLHRHFFGHFIRARFFAHFQLHQVGRINARVARSAEVPLGV